MRIRSVVRQRQKAQVTKGGASRVQGQKSNQFSPSFPERKQRNTLWHLPHTVLSWFPALMIKVFRALNWGRSHPYCHHTHTKQQHQIRIRTLFPINCLPLSASRHLSSFQALLGHKAHLFQWLSHFVFIRLRNGHKWLSLSSSGHQPQGHPSPDQNWDISLCGEICQEIGDGWA